MGMPHGEINRQRHHRNNRCRCISMVWQPQPQVGAAAQPAAEVDVGALLVLDGERLAGVFSERDYARKGILMGRSSSDAPVSQIMSSPVVTVTPAKRSFGPMICRNASSIAWPVTS